MQGAAQDGRLAGKDNAEAGMATHLHMLAFLGNVYTTEI